MAHWIIDFHGFAGTYYTCSECGESYCDIYNDMCGDDECPNCGAQMDEDKTVYMKNGKVEK